MGDKADKLLPIANVGRIMKQILPPNAKISKEAKLRMQECTSEFISFVTAEASDRCQKVNRRTLNGDDLCWALCSLGFDNYSEAMRKYLLKFRKFEEERAAFGKKPPGIREENGEPSTSEDVQPTNNNTSSLLITVMDRQH